MPEARLCGTYERNRNEHPTSRNRVSRMRIADSPLPFREECRSQLRRLQLQDARASVNQASRRTVSEIAPCPRGESGKVNCARCSYRYWSKLSLDPCRRSLETPPSVAPDRDIATDSFEALFLRELTVVGTLWPPRVKHCIYGYSSHLGIAHDASALPGGLPHLAQRAGASAESVL